MRRLAAFLITLLAGLCLAGSAQAANWGSAFDLSVPATGTSNANQLSVIDREGGGFIYVWSNTDAATAGVRSRVVYPDGRRGPINLIRSGSQYVIPVGLEASGSGENNRVLMLYQGKSCSVCGFYYDVLLGQLDRNGQFVEQPQLIDSSPDSNWPDQIYAPDLSVAPDGSTMAAWTFSDVGVGNQVRIALAEPGEPAETFPLTDAGTAYELPTVAAKNGGGGFLGMIQGNAPTVSGTMVAADATHTPFQTMGAGQGGSYLKSVIDSAGKATATFRENLNSDFGLYMRQMDSNGDVIGASETLLRGDDVSFDSDSGSLNLGPDDKVIQTWSQYDDINGTDVAYLRWISSGGTPQNPVQLSDETLDATAPVLSFGSVTGPTAYFALNGGLAAGLDVVAQSLDSGLQPIGNPRTLGEYPADDYLGAMARPAVAASGDTSVAWITSIATAGYSRQVDAAIYDATGPELDLTVPASTTQGFNTTMAATSSDPSGPVMLEWDFGDGGTTSGTSLASHAYPSTGTFTVSVKATDDAGNETTRTAQIEVVAEPDPNPPKPPAAPSTTITARPAKSTRSKAATFRFTADQAGEAFECRLDRAGWSDCRSPKRLKKLRPGKHTFRVRSTRGDLIDLSPASYTWTVKKPKKKRR